jgi:uncharacterized membrane protein YesL
MAKKPSDLLSGSEVGGSAFAQVTTSILWFMMLTGLIIVASLPGFILGLFLAPTPGNLPLAFACLLFVGPAASAALFAWRRRDLDGPDLVPGGHFWRGYRLNVADVLKWWVPYLLLLATMTFVSVNIQASGWPPELVWVFVVIAAILTLVAGHMIVITSLFSFRTRDTARLSLLFLFKHWRTTLADACLLVGMGLLTRWPGEWAVAIFSSVFALWWLRLARAEIEDATANFVHQEPAAPADDDSSL